MTVPPGADNRVSGRGFAGTWAELAPWPLPPVALVPASSQWDAARAAWSGVLGGGEFLIVEAARVGADEQAWAVAGASRAPEPGRIWLLTSGTTGRPKRVGHTLASLTTVSAPQPERTWLCPYTPGSYAWWQVVSLSLAVPGQHVVFVEPDELDAWPELAAAAGVDAVSGTPTFWRRTLLRHGSRLGELGLKQVTLGGEPVDQQVLDQVSGVFAEARVTWIYASSEAGAAIAVHDRRAGFPVGWLGSNALSRPVLAVEGGELIIGSAKRGADVPEMLHTGDRAVIEGDRVLIVGRLDSDEINVGGAKVSAAAVREVLLALPGVHWAAVRGRRAPLVGAMVVAEVVADDELTDEAIRAHCVAHLPEHAVPRQVRRVDEIPVARSLKSDV